MEDLTDEVRRMEALLDAPEHVAKGIDRRAAVETAARAQEGYRYPGSAGLRPQDGRRAVKRSGLLLEQITQGHADPGRDAPQPGRCGRQASGWERRNKKKIEEWKNIQLRLHATGGADRLSDEADVANLER